MTMLLPDLRAVYFACMFKDTPIFQEKMGAVVAQHMSQYPSWSRRQDGFSLWDDARKIDIRILFDSLRAIKEGKINTEDLEDFTGKVRNLVFDTLHTLDVDSLNEVFLRGRFYLHSEDPKKLVPILLNTFASNNLSSLTPINEGRISDFQYTIVFSLTPNIDCKLWLYVVLGQRELRYAFPSTYKECEPGGLVITVEIKQPPEQDLTSLGDVEKMLRYFQEQSINIARNVLSNIPELSNYVSQGNH